MFFLLSILYCASCKAAKSICARLTSFKPDAELHPESNDSVGVAGNDDKGVTGDGDAIMIGFLGGAAFLDVGVGGNDSLGVPGNDCEGVGGRDCKGVGGNDSLGVAGNDDKGVPPAEVDGERSVATHGSDLTKAPFYEPSLGCADAFLFRF